MARNPFPRQRIQLVARAPFTAAVQALADKAAPDDERWLGPDEFRFVTSGGTVGPARSQDAGVTDVRVREVTLIRSRLTDLVTPACYALVGGKKMTIEDVERPDRFHITLTLRELV